MSGTDRPTPATGQGAGGTPSVMQRLRSSETGTAAILAGAMIMTNVVALVTTIAFGRLLGVKGYGELAAILSSFIILSVPGAALQVATAREGALGHLGEGRQFATTLSRWTRTLVVTTVAVGAVSILLREQLAGLINVKQEWAVAAVPPGAVIWILLSVQRGALQASRAYMTVGMSMIAEQSARLVLGAGLALGGMSVTGAYLGTPLAMTVTSVVLAMLLSRRLGGHDRERTSHRLRALAAKSQSAIVGLALIAVLQNIDVIVAQNRLGGEMAGTYAAAAVAAKVVVWVAIGIGFYLLPEAARKHAANEDARPVLMKALALTGAVAAPCLVIYAFFPELLLRLAFGPKYEGGAQALLELGAAMALLSVCYLAVQLLLALREIRFLYVLGVIAAAEPLALIFLPQADTINGFAGTVLIVQAVAAIGSLAAAYRASAPPSGAGERGSSTLQTPNRATST